VRREGLLDAWSLTSREDVSLDDGLGPLEFVDPQVPPARWFEIGPGRTAPPPPGADPAAAVRAMRGKAVRALYRRVHLRVRGDGDMQLSLRAWIALEKVHTRPRMDASLDGELVGAVLPDDAGRYALDVRIPRERLAGGWRDLYLVFNSIAEPDNDSREPRVAVLESVSFTPAP
jgi:hypothetical protein